MWSVRRSLKLGPITRRWFNRSRMILTSSPAAERGWPSFGSPVATGVILVGGCICLGAITYYNIPVSPPLEAEVDCLLRAFSEGRGSEEFEKADNEDSNMDRQDLLKKLVPILQPKSPSKTYAVIVGERGTGKSTAVRKAISSLQKPTGVVYFQCSASARMFSIELAQLIGYRRQINLGEGATRALEMKTKENRGLHLADEPLGTFETLQKPLLDAAAKFEATNKRPMVLVIDAVDDLAKKTHQFLETLQDFAKRSADNGDLRIVFVTSDDGSALPLLMARSPWSRAGKPTEIGEIPDDQAVDYLIKKGVPEDQAKIAVVNLTGGLFMSLSIFAEANSKGTTCEQMITERDRYLKVLLTGSETPADHALFRHLTEHKIIGMDEAVLFRGIKKVHLEDLVRNNVLSAHPDRTYTFHDRHTAVWFSKQVTESMKKKSTLWWPIG